METLLADIPPSTAAYAAGLLLDDAGVSALRESERLVFGSGEVASLHMDPLIVLMRVRDDCVVEAVEQLTAFGDVQSAAALLTVLQRCCPPSISKTRKEEVHMGYIGTPPPAAPPHRRSHALRARRLAVIARHVRAGDRRDPQVPHRRHSRHEHREHSHDPPLARVMSEPAFCAPAEVHFRPVQLRILRQVARRQPLHSLQRMPFCALPLFVVVRAAHQGPRSLARSLANPAP